MFFRRGLFFERPHAPQSTVITLHKKGKPTNDNAREQERIQRKQEDAPETLIFMQVNSHKDRTWPYIKHSNQLLRSLGCNFPQDKLFCQAFRSWYLFVVVRLGFELGACLTGECPHVGLGLTFFKRSARSCSWYLLEVWLLIPYCATANSREATWKLNCNKYHPGQVLHFLREKKICIRAVYSRSTEFNRPLNLVRDKGIYSTRTGSILTSAGRRECAWPGGTKE